MGFALHLLAAAGFLIVPITAYADDIAGSLVLRVTETAVAPTQGTLRRDEVVAIHEIRADRGAVVLERAGPGAVSSQAGDVLIALSAGDRAHLYCDIASRRALTGGFIPCFEDRDSDGRLETRYLGSTRMEIPSSFLILVAPDNIAPAAYREAEVHERPIVRFGYEPCALGRHTTFKLVVSTDAEHWSGGGRCQTAETIADNGIRFILEAAENGVYYRLTEPLEPGEEVLFFPNLN